MDARQQDLMDRFKNLKDARHAFDIVINGSNPDRWLLDKLEDADYAAVEQLMKDLEAKDIELETVRNQDIQKETVIKDAVGRIKLLELSAVDPVIKDILIILKALKK